MPKSCKIRVSLVFACLTGTVACSPSEILNAKWSRVIDSTSQTTSARTSGTVIATIHFPKELVTAYYERFATQSFAPVKRLRVQLEDANGGKQEKTAYPTSEQVSVQFEQVFEGDYLLYAEAYGSDSSGSEVLVGSNILPSQRGQKIQVKANNTANPTINMSILKADALSSGSPTGVPSISSGADSSIACNETSFKGLSAPTLCALTEKNGNNEDMVTFLGGGFSTNPALTYKLFYDGNVAEENTLVSSDGTFARRILLQGRAPDRFKIQVTDSSKFVTKEIVTTGLTLPGGVTPPITSGSSNVACNESAVSSVTEPMLCAYAERNGNNEALVRFLGGGYTKNGGVSYKIFYDGSVIEDTTGLLNPNGLFSKVVVLNGRSPDRFKIQLTDQMKSVTKEISTTGLTLSVTNPPPSGKPTVSMTPSGTITKGLAIALNGQGFTPNSQISIYIATTAAAQQIPVRTNSDSQGNFTYAYPTDTMSELGQYLYYAADDAKPGTYSDKIYWALQAAQTQQTSPTMIKIYRFRRTDKTRYFYTTDPAGEGSGFVSEGNVFNMFPAGTPNSTAVYRCWNENTGHFYTVQSNCEDPVNYRQEGILGYVINNQDTGSYPFYRFRVNGLGAHFYTAFEQMKNIALSEGWLSDGVMGYVQLPSSTEPSPLYPTN